MTLQIWFQQNTRLLTWLSGGIIAVAAILTFAQLPGGAALFAIAGVVAGVPVLLRAIAALKARVISIELLVTLAVIGAYAIGEYHEAAIVTFLFLFGNLLEAKTLAKTREAVRSLTEMAPTTAQVIDDEGHLTTVDVDDVEIGDKVQVVTGDSVPVDGVVISGQGSLNTAAITGESDALPVTSDSEVLSGSIVEDGTLIIRATRVADDTTFARIIELVEEAQDAKSPVERFIDRFATYYTPAVLIIAVITFAITRNLNLAITLLVLGCPGALVIGAPVSTVAGVGNGARRGILFKGGDALTALAQANHFFFDKTGTLTVGKPAVARVAGDLSAQDWQIIHDIESEATHPLAQAVSAYAQQQFGSETKRSDLTVNTVKGRGLIGQREGERWLIGNQELLADNGVSLNETQQQDLDALRRDGLSLVLVAQDTTVKAIIGISDVQRPEAAEALNALHEQGCKTLTMLTGDHEQAAATIASELPLDDYRAALLPEQKLDIVQDAQAAGQVVGFVGDGVNDAPALATSDVGVAIGGGTDVAIETAPVVLMQSNLMQLVAARRLARKTVLTTQQNIFVAVAVVALLLVGLLFGVVDMASGMLIHELSILVVILNAMRLIRFDQTKQLDRNQVQSEVNPIH